MSEWQWFPYSHWHILQPKKYNFWSSIEVIFTSDIFQSKYFHSKCYMSLPSSPWSIQVTRVSLTNIIFQLHTAAFKVYCAIWVRCSNFRHQVSPHVSPHESTQRQKVELWAWNVQKFCLNAELHITFRDLLHAVKLWHGTDGFTSPPKEGVLRIFSP
jgi:hypothetical protein